MTLKQWSEASNAVVNDSNGCKHVTDTCAMRPALFRLTDYAVSSVTAGTIYLVPRQVAPYWLSPV